MKITRTVWPQIIDWWRGYSETDIASLEQKMQGNTIPGDIIFISDRERRAMPEYGRRLIKAIKDEAK